MSIPHNINGDETGNVPKKRTFFEMVMTALHIKGRSNDYQQLPHNDDEGRVLLEEGDVSTQIPGDIKPKKIRYCDVNFTLFWKALGVVLLGFALWFGFKFFRAPTSVSVPAGLEHMPDYSMSLGCQITEHRSKGVYLIPVGPTSAKPTHQLNVKGGAAGTILITEAPSGATDITIELTLLSGDKASLEDVKTWVTPPESDEEWTTATITTPLTIPKSCMRYDIVLYVPPTLKTLNIDAHAIAQIKFDPNAQIQLDNLLIQTYGIDERTMILPTEGIKANRLEINAYRGWLVGDMAITNETIIVTKQGPVVTNIHFHPTAALDLKNPEPAYLTTRTDRGRTDIFYENHKDPLHRPIVSEHISGRMMGQGGDIHLIYKNAEFSGRVDVKAKSYTAHNLEGNLPRPDQAEGTLGYHGGPDGGDSLWVRSAKGWVGLYF